MSKPIIFLDTETGGLYPSQHALLSIGVCCSWGAPPLTLYITAESQPGKTVDPEAAVINGYTPEKWAERGAMPKLATELRALKAHRRFARLVAHHHAFDRGFLDEASRICEIDLPGRYDWRCSMLLMGEMMDEGLVPWGGLGLARLGELSGQWPKGGRPDVHDVAEDARVGLTSYQWLLELRAKKKGGRGMSYELSITQGSGRVLLSATLEQRDNQVLHVSHAAIHIDKHGKVSVEGMAAFRCLSMAELIVAAALKTDTIDPFAARVELLEAEVLRLRNQLQTTQ